MTESRIVTCDRCNQYGDINPPKGRGMVCMNAEEAVDAGWAREPGSHIDGCDDTHYCIDCLDEEERSQT